MMATTTHANRYENHVSDDADRAASSPTMFIRVREQHARVEPRVEIKVNAVASKHGRTLNKQCTHSE